MKVEAITTMNDYLNNINSNFPSIVIITILIIIYLSVKQIIEVLTEINTGIQFLLNTYLLSIIIVWSLLLNMVLILAIFLFYICLLYNSINFIIIKSQVLILLLIIFTIILDFFLLNQVKIILNKFVKDRKMITDKYIAFLVKIMTSLTLLMTGLYTMFTDNRMFGFIIATCSITTVVLSFIELYRIIKAQNWK